MFYEGALIISAAVSIAANIFLIGTVIGWKRKASFWRNKYDDAIEKVVPPIVNADPYERVKADIGYDWEEAWD